MADRLGALEELRDILRSELDAGVSCKKCGGVVASSTPALAKQYRDTLREVDELKRGQPKGSIVDELAGRRNKDRKPDAKGSGPAARRRPNAGA